MTIRSSVRAAGRAVVRARLAAITIMAGLLGATVPASAMAEEPVTLVRPIPGPLVAAFDVGPNKWSAGHRGADLAGAPGDPVVAAGAGVVSFAGMVAGRPVVSVVHSSSGLRTTYEPVRSEVALGQRLAAGERIGTLLAGHACSTGVCLHWGLRDDDSYYAPMARLSLERARVRLLPLAAEPVEASPLEARPAAAGGLASGSSPVSGRVTSQFGMRRHPITGVLKAHSGVDIAAACGVPVTSPWPGKVVAASKRSGFGNHVVVDHGVVGGARLTSSYSHLQGFSVRAGDRLPAGGVLGVVGRTGTATGCHLHFQVWADGGLVDPLRLLR